MVLAKWPLLSDTEVLKTPIFTVRNYLCRSPKDGQEKSFTVLDTRDWVQVVAITTDEQIVVVRQFRQGTRQETIELPGGVVDAGQTPMDAARRELKEETGYEAEKWTFLTSFRPNPATQTNTTHLILAENASLVGPTNFDENEDLETETIPRKELRLKILKGEIDHAIMVAAILYYFAQCEVN